MHIKSVAIEGFLSYEKLQMNGDLQLSQGCNLILGKNGSGKSNLLKGKHFYKFDRSWLPPTPISTSNLRSFIVILQPWFLRSAISLNLTASKIRERCFMKAWPEQGRNAPQRTVRIHRLTWSKWHWTTPTGASRSRLTTYKCAKLTTARRTRRITTSMESSSVRRSFSTCSRAVASHWRPILSSRSLSRGRCKI